MKYSVIVPVFNEAESIPPLTSQIIRTMDSLREPYELIYINDGSEDNSLEVIKCLLQTCPHVVLIDLAEHLGKSAAMQAGFDHFSGETVITIDGDLQNNPGDIPLMLREKEKGFDVVCGWRHDRHDAAGKKLFSKMGNFVRRIFFRESIHDVGCMLRVYSSAALKGIKLSGERHRFLTAILSMRGCNIGEIKVRHHKRRYGASKYGNIDRTFKSIPEFLRLLFFRERSSIRENNLYRIREVIKST
jgi:dolichol-phosphate mannosyltransferase